MTVKSLKVQIGADTKDMERGLKSARAKMKAFGNQIKKIGKVMAVAGAAVVGAIALMVRSYVKAGDEIHKMALRTGFSTEALSALKYAAEISGASIDDLEKAVKKMAKTISDASKEGGALATYVRAFDRIGLSAEDLLELSPEEQFDKITRAIADLESPTLRAALAQEIFGRAGTKLLPLMAEGAEGIDKLTKKAEQLGLIWSQDAANAAAKLNDSITTLRGSFTGLTRRLVEELVPAFSVIADEFTNAAVSLQDNAKTMAQSLLKTFEAITEGAANLVLFFLWMQWKLGEGIINISKTTRKGLESMKTFTEKVNKVFEKLGWGVETIKEVDDAIDTLRITEGTYRGKVDDTVGKIEEALAVYAKLKEALDKAKDAIRETGEATGDADEYVSELKFSFQGVDDALKELDTTMKKQTAHLAIVPPIVGDVGTAYEEMARRVKTANEILMESWNLTTEAQLEFAQIAISNFASMEANLKGFVTAILNTLEQWAIGEIIAKVMKALPFPANLFATGGAILAVKALFAAIKPKSMAEGGFVPKETIARLHPGEYVLNAPTVKALSAPGGMAGSSPFPNRLYNDITVVIGGVRFKQLVVRTVNEASNDRELRIKSHSVVD